MLPRLKVTRKVSLRVNNKDLLPFTKLRVFHEALKPPGLKLSSQRTKNSNICFGPQVLRNWAPNQEYTQYAGFLVTKQVTVSIQV